MRVPKVFLMQYEKSLSLEEQTELLRLATEHLAFMRQKSLQSEADNDDDGNDDDGDYTDQLMDYYMCYVDAHRLKRSFDDYGAYFPSADVTQHPSKYIEYLSLILLDLKERTKQRKRERNITPSEPEDPNCRIEDSDKGTPQKTGPTGPGDPGDTDDSGDGMSMDPDEEEEEEDYEY